MSQGNRNLRPLDDLLGHKVPVLQQGFDAGTEVDAMNERFFWLLLLFPGACLRGDEVPGNPPRLSQGQSRADRWICGIYPNQTGVAWSWKSPS